VYFYKITPDQKATSFAAVKVALKQQFVQGAPWSWKVMEFIGRPFSRPGKSWKIAKVMESRGKVMENDDNVIESLLLH